MIVFPSMPHSLFTSLPNTSLPARLYDRDLLRRHQNPQYVFDGIQREANDPAETVPRYARRIGSGDAERQVGRFGDFFLSAHGTTFPAWRHL
jgi:hypothetical protein